MMKRVLSFVTVVSLALSFSTSIFAEANTTDMTSSNLVPDNYIESSIGDSQNIEDSQLFDDYISNAFEDLSALTVKDSTGTDFTNEFIEFASKPYYSGDYKNIKKFILEHNLTLGYREKNPSIMGTISLNGANTLAATE